MLDWIRRRIYLYLAKRAYNAAQRKLRWIAAAETRKGDLDR
jgi:hypothetical protein